VNEHNRLKINFFFIPVLKNKAPKKVKTWVFFRKPSTQEQQKYPACLVRCFTNLKQ
jgi:hypothetical protein